MTLITEIVTETEVKNVAPVASVGQAPAPWLTMEHALYALLILLALGMRFFALGVQPLNPLEAANAWPAWLAATGLTAPNLPTPSSPLLYALHTLLFWLAGGSDALARALPALFGAGLIGLVWIGRHWLGRSTAFWAALLIVFDPWLVAYSRLADGAILSLFLGLLTLLGLAQWQIWAVDDPARTRWQTITAASAGLLVVSGAQAWSFIPVLLLFWVLWNRGAEQTRPVDETVVRVDGETATSLGGVPPRSFPSSSVPRSMFLIFITAAVLGATGWLAHLEGLGLVSSSLSVWSRQLTGAGSVTYPLSWPFIRLLVDQPFLLVFGLIGLVQLWLRANRGDADETLSNHSAPMDTLRWPLFLTAWLVWGLILVLLPGRNPFSLAMLGLPLLLAAAHAAGVVMRQFQPQQAWREAKLVIGMLVILLISALFWAIALLFRPQLDPVLVRTTLLLVGLAIILAILFMLWSNRRQMRFVFGGLAGALLLLITFAASWQLNGQFELAHPDGFFAEFTSPEVRQLAIDVTTLSAQRSGDPEDALIQVQMAAQPDPVLGWYLRQMRRLTWVLAPGASEVESPLVISLSSSADTNDLLPNYMGSDYDIYARWLPSQLFATEAGLQVAPDDANQYWTARLRPFLRWAIYREVKSPLIFNPVVLWVPVTEN